MLVDVALFTCDCFASTFTSKGAEAFNKVKQQRRFQLSVSGRTVMASQKKKLETKKEAKGHMQNRMKQALRRKLTLSSPTSSTAHNDEMPGTLLSSLRVLSSIA